MDREHLEDYEQKENEEYKRLEKRIREGKFSFEKDRYPPDERFVKLQKPVAVIFADATNLWGQIPFSGSLILSLPPVSKHEIEKEYFKISEIPKVIEFIKETGRLQISLSARPTMYEGFEHLDIFFEELTPPSFSAAPLDVLAGEKELREAANIFYTLGEARYFDFLREESQHLGSHAYSVIVEKDSYIYAALKLGKYGIVEEIESLMIDDPERALYLLGLCEAFITSPILDLRSDLRNFTLEEIKSGQDLPLVYRPEEIRFPHEIGKFLLKKFTCAPQGIRACYDIIDHYNAYDLQKVQESLNDAIVTNHPEIINKRVVDLSEILDNIWDDKTIPKRIKNINVGVPISIAAVGSVAGGLVGGLAGVGTGGFLAELGFKVAEKAVEKFFTVKGEGLSEKIAKLRTKSYQANVYDFKKKYKGKLVHP